MADPANTAYFFQELYRAFNSRQVEAVLASFHPDVEWPDTMRGLPLRGRDAVREYWLQQWQEIDPMVEPIGIHTMADGQVKVRVRQLVRDLEGNELMDMEVLHVYRLDSDGLVTHMEVAEGEPSTDPSLSGASQE